MKNIGSLLMVLGASLLPLSLSHSPQKNEPFSVVTPSPVCECTVCKCDLCTCTLERPTPISITEEPAAPAPVIVKAPDTIKADEIAMAPVDAEPKFTQPQVLPVKPAPQPQVLPTKPVAASTSGHYEYRQMCGPNGCSMQQVWVPHTQGQTYTQPQQTYTSYGSCGPGGCGRRGLFGRRR